VEIENKAIENTAEEGICTKEKYIAVISESAK